MIKKLNVDKIKDIEDVKRIFEFMKVEAEVTEDIAPIGYEKVKDLFEANEPVK